MGKGGDKSDLQKEKVKEVLLNGVYYDISEMKHPGGSVIEFYTNNNIDATQAFENFHFRSLRAKKFLDSLPSRPADAKAIKKNQLEGQEELLRDFEELQAALVREGYFKPSISHTLYRLTELVLMHLVGGWLILHNQVVLGVILLALGQGRCGWLMHEGGHYSLTGNIKIDKYIQMVVYGLGCGMSGGWWRSQHNKHHAMPQKIGHDVDLNTLPLVAFTDRVLSRVGGLQKMWLLPQAILFPVVTTLLVALGWQFYLHPRHIVRSKNGFEGAMLLLRYILWSVFFTTKFGLLQSTLLYLAYDWIGANYIFINFALSHTHLDTVPKDDTKVMHSLSLSINHLMVLVGRLGSFRRGLHDEC